MPLSLPVQSAQNPEDVFCNDPHLWNPSRIRLEFFTPSIPYSARAWVGSESEGEPRPSSLVPEELLIGPNTSNDQENQPRDFLPLKIDAIDGRLLLRLDNPGAFEEYCQTNELNLEGRRILQGAVNEMVLRWSTYMNMLHSKGRKDLSDEAKARCAKMRKGEKNEKEEKETPRDRLPVDEDLAAELRKEDGRRRARVEQLMEEAGMGRGEAEACVREETLARMGYLESMRRVSEQTDVESEGSAVKDGSGDAEGGGDDETKWWEFDPNSGIHPRLEYEIFTDHSRIPPPGPVMVHEYVDVKSITIRYDDALAHEAVVTRPPLQSSEHQAGAHDLPVAPSDTPVNDKNLENQQQFDKQLANKLSPLSRPLFFHPDHFASTIPIPMPAHAPSQHAKPPSHLSNPVNADIAMSPVSSPPALVLTPDSDSNSTSSLAREIDYYNATPPRRATSPASVGIMAIDGLEELVGNMAISDGENGHLGLGENIERLAEEMGAIQLAGRERCEEEDEEDWYNASLVKPRMGRSLEDELAGLRFDEEEEEGEEEGEEVEEEKGEGHEENLDNLKPIKTKTESDADLADPMGALHLGEEKEEQKEKKPKVSFAELPEMRDAPWAWKMCSGCGMVRMLGRIWRCADCMPKIEEARAAEKRRSCGEKENAKEDENTLTFDNDADARAALNSSLRHFKLRILPAEDSVDSLKSKFASA